MRTLLTCTLAAILAGAAGLADASPRDRGHERGYSGYGHADHRWHGGERRHGRHDRHERRHRPGPGYRPPHGQAWRPGPGHRPGPAYRPGYGHGYGHVAPRPYLRPPGYRPYRWSHGHHLPRGYYAPAYYVDYRPYRLAPPPYGHRWVRVDGDVILVALATGLVVDIVHGLFR